MPKVKSEKNIKANLKKLLDAYPSMVDNKNKLIAHYWYIFDDIKTIEDAEDATSAESILRDLRRLVDTGAVAAPKRRRERAEVKVKEFTHEFSSLT
jgi:hypothetical protein